MGRLSGLSVKRDPSHPKHTHTVWGLQQRRCRRGLAGWRKDGSAFLAFTPNPNTFTGESCPPPNSLHQRRQHVEENLAQCLNPTLRIKVLESTITLFISYKNLQNKVWIAEYPAGLMGSGDSRQEELASCLHLSGRVFSATKNWEGAAVQRNAKVGRFMKKTTRKICVANLSRQIQLAMDRMPDLWRRKACSVESAPRRGASLIRSFPRVIDSLTKTP